MRVPFLWWIYISYIVWKVRMVFVIVNNVTKGVCFAGKVHFWLKLKKNCEFSLKRGTKTPQIFCLLYRSIFEKLRAQFLNVLVAVLTPKSNPGCFYHKKCNFGQKLRKSIKNTFLPNILKYLVYSCYFSVYLCHKRKYFTKMIVVVNNFHGRGVFWPKKRILGTKIMIFQLLCQNCTIWCESAIFVMNLYISYIVWRVRMVLVVVNNVTKRVFFGGKGSFFG